MNSGYKCVCRRHNKAVDNLSAMCYIDIADRLSIYYGDHIPHIRTKTVKIVLGVRHFLLYFAFIMAFAFATGLVVNLI